MFLVKRDFYRFLNSSDVGVLLTESELYSDTILDESIGFAVEFVKSKIQHRYDPLQIFIDVVSFSLSSDFTEGSLVLYTEPSYSESENYVLNDRVSYNNLIYKANQATTGVFNSEHWDLVTQNESYYYVTADTTGNYPENTDYFTKGDNRNALIRDYTITLTLEQLFLRVNPRVIPEWVITKSEQATEHLNRISNGKDMVALPVKTDADGNTEGNTFRYGSETQKDWRF